MIFLALALLGQVAPPLPAPAQFHRLQADHAEASSFLQSNWNKYEENYHPSYVLDDDPKTAWVEGVDGDGAGESITIPVSTLKDARTVRLVIWNGYQKSKMLLDANGAPTSLGVVVRGYGGTVSADTAITLDKKMGPQSFDIPLKRGGGIATVTLTIKGVLTGKVYKDTCVSDVQIFIDSDAPYLKNVEDAKHASLLAWKKSRLDTAKYFASLPPSYPFAATQFTPHSSEDTVVQHHYLTGDDGRTPDPHYRALQDLLAAHKTPVFDAADKDLVERLSDLVVGKLPEQPAYVSIAFKHKPVLPELNLPIDEAVAPLFFVDSTTLFEASGPGSLKAKPIKTDGSMQSELTVGNALVVEKSATTNKPTLLYVPAVLVGFERTTYTEHYQYLVALDDKGAPRAVAKLSNDESTMGTVFEISVAHFTLGSGSKVSAIDDVTVRDIDGPGADADDNGIITQRNQWSALPSSPSPAH